MKKEVITVTIPQDKTFVKFLMDLRELIDSAWLFIDEYEYRKLLKELTAIPVAGRNCVSFSSFNSFPYAKIVVSSERPTIWKEIVEIDAFNICFHVSARDPKRILFFVTEIPN